MEDQTNAPIEPPAPDPVPEPEASIPEKAKTYLAPFVEKHAKLLNQVLMAATMTATQWWQQRHAEAVQAHKFRVQSETKALADAVSSITSDGSKEDTEKAVKDAAKALATEREEWSVYVGRVIAPIRAAVHSYGDFCEEVLSDVNEHEKEDGLHFPKPLADRIREELSTWPKVTFNEDTGIVSIGEPGEVVLMMASAPSASEPAGIEAAATTDVPPDDKPKTERRSKSIAEIVGPAASPQVPADAIPA